MIGKSDLPFRLLLKSYGFEVCWTPMFHAEDFASASKQDRFRQGFDTCIDDRPLVVQFGTNNANDFLESALAVQDQCVAVDLNLGCPQQKAMKGGWGGALMDEENWHLVRDIVKRAVTSPLLRVPITCKIRIFDNDRKTVRFAKMLEEAGCSLLTVHGRQRCRELHHAPANWSVIREVRKALRIPVIANGGISSRATAEECLEKTGCAAVMIATAAVSDPEMLLQVNIKGSISDNDEFDDGDNEESTACSRSSNRKQEQLQAVVDRCLRYLEFCEDHPPWSTRGPKEHLRSWLAPFCSDLDSLEKVGEDAAPSPAPFKDEEARRSHWQILCSDLRAAVQAARISASGCLDETPSARADKSSGDSHCKKMQALGRTVQVSSRYVEEQRRKAAALRSCMVGAKSTKTKAANR
jgi:tRNA-dihydrouridine synthase